MKLNESYFVPAVPCNRIAPKSSDAKHAQTMQQSVERIEDARKRMYQIVADNLDGYCRGEVLPGECAMLPTVGFLQEGIHEDGEVSVGEFRFIIKSRLFALINEYIEENKESLAQKPAPTKKPRKCEAFESACIS